MENRTNWVDYAKAIGIILVVYGHVARGLYQANFDFPPETFKLIDSIIYSFHMPLFFFLSGLFFYNSFSKRGGKNLIFSKIDTIFYPYMVWSLFQGTIEVSLSSYTNASASLSEVLSFLWQPRAQFWFLFCLFFIFIYTTLIYSVLPKRHTPIIFLVSGLLFLLPSLPNTLFSGSYVTNNIVYFIFGIFFSSHIKEKIFSTNKSLILLALLFILSQACFHFFEHSLSLPYKSISALLLAFISILFIVALSISLAKNVYSEFFILIGTSSMAIYLMHVLAGSGSRIVLRNVFNIESVYIHLLIGMLTGILVPIFTLLLIKKYQVSYIFSAPLCAWCKQIYSKMRCQIR